MYTINSSFYSQIDVKKSVFISHIFQYNFFDQNMQILREKNPKARHFVYAYRFFNENMQIVENSSDDGEPRGTSGKPTLKVLQGNLLINVAIITVRFFGGIKLGTGGLVRAYSDSANEVIKNANLIKYEQKTTKNIEILYQNISKVEYLIDKYDLSIINKDFFDTFAIYSINGVEDSILEFMKYKQDLLFKSI